MRAVIDDDRVPCATLRALLARWVRLNARRHADGRYDTVAAGEHCIADLAALCQTESVDDVLGERESNAST